MPNLLVFCHIESRSEHFISFDRSRIGKTPFVVVNSLPSTVITAPAAVCADSTGNKATDADAGSVAIYFWTITNSTLTGGSTTPRITLMKSWSGAVSQESLNATGLAAIQKGTGGKTQLKIYFPTATNNNSTNDYIGFYGGEAATTTNRPRLVVTYTP